MKLILTAALGLILGTAAIANPVDAAAEAANETKLDSAITRLESVALAGRGTREDYTRVKTALEARAADAISFHKEEANIRTRLARAVDDLEARAKRANLHAINFQILRERVLDARLDRATARLQHYVRTGRVTPREYAAMKELIDARAAIAKDDAQAQNTRKRLNDAVTALEAKAKTAATAIDPVAIDQFRVAAIDTRLERYIGYLKTSHEAGRGSDEDYESAIDNVHIRAQAAMSHAPMPESDVTKYQNALKELQQNYSGEKLAILMAELTGRAREASSPR